MVAEARAAAIHATAARPANLIFGMTRVFLDAVTCIAIHRVALAAIAAKPYNALVTITGCILQREWGLYTTLEYDSNVRRGYRK